MRVRTCEVVSHGVGGPTSEGTYATELSLLCRDDAEGDGGLFIFENRESRMKAGMRRMGRDEIGDDSLVDGRAMLHLEVLGKV